MPIHCPISIARLTRGEFLERDRIVMGCAYAAQNRLGRLCNERVYENDLAARLKAEGMRNVLAQVPLTVTHGCFSKEYRLDLVADDAVYDGKTVSQFIGEHDAQVLNYAMMLDILCIKLLNFRNARVQGRIQFSALTRVQRLAFDLDFSKWIPLSPRCSELKRHLSSLLEDIGAFLDTRLYEEALSTLTPAPATSLAVVRDGIELGTHRVLMLAEHVAFCVTAFTASLDQQRSHLTRLLDCLPLKGLQWINLNHSAISMETLVKEIAPLHHPPNFIPSTPFL